MSRTCPVWWMTRVRPLALTGRVKDQLPAPVVELQVPANTPANPTVPGPATG